MDNFLGRNDGQVQCTGVLHIVQQGDTLYKIGKKYGAPVSRIMYANPYVNVYNLQEGDEICVPVMRPRTGDTRRNDRMNNEQENRMEHGNADIPEKENQTEDEPADMPSNMLMKPEENRTEVPEQRRAEERNTAMPEQDRRTEERNTAMPEQDRRAEEGNTAMPEQDRRAEERNTAMPEQRRTGERNMAMPGQERRMENGSMVMPVRNRCMDNGNMTAPGQESSVEDGRDTMTSRYENGMDERMSLIHENAVDGMAEPVRRAAEGSDSGKGHIPIPDRNLCRMEPLMENGKHHMMGFGADISCEKTAGKMPWDKKAVSKEMMEAYLSSGPQQNMTDRS